MTTPRTPLLIQNLRVPTLPALVHRLLQLIDKPNVGTAEVGAIIKEDPPLAGKVLRIVNSSYYGLPEPCVSVEKASTLLGLKLVKNIVVQAALIEDSERLASLGFDVAHLWRRSALTAKVAALIARHSRSRVLPAEDEAYLMGLLLDIGQVVLLDNLGDRYVALHENARQYNQSLFLAERRDLGLTHAEIGGYVANVWGFSEQVKRGIDFHHGRRQSDFEIPEVYLAIQSSQLVERMLSGHVGTPYVPLDTDAEIGCGIKPEAVEAAIDYVRGVMATTPSDCSRSVA